MSVAQFLLVGPKVRDCQLPLRLPEPCVPLHELSQWYGTGYVPPEPVWSNTVREVPHQLGTFLILTQALLATVLVVPGVPRSMALLSVQATGATQRAPVQVPDTQSSAVSHTECAAQLPQSSPPQSVSVSLPSRTLLWQLGPASGCAGGLAQPSPQ